MLSWDEPTPAKMPLPATPSPRMPSMPPRMPAPASTLLDPTTAVGLADASRLHSGTQIARDTRRVRVEDKRIINGAADVNQLVPFKYK